MTAAMLLLVLGVVRRRNARADRADAGARRRALAAFVAIERRTAAPLVRLGILRSGPLVRANLGAMLFVGSFFAFQFVVVLYLQELRGWSALETGLALLVSGIDAVLAPTLTPGSCAASAPCAVSSAGWSLAAAPTRCSCRSAPTGPTRPCCRR